MSPKTEDPDVGLMLRFQAGDRGAFETLFQRYSVPLVAFLGRMVPDRGRAEDLAQEVFVRLFRAKDRYQPRAKFSTFLFGIAHNLALNELARAYRGRERPLEALPEHGFADPAPGADEELEARRIASRLELALMHLPDRQRAALVLRAEHDLGYEEIAAALGTSVSSVKSLLHRARAHLLAELKEAPA